MPLTECVNQLPHAPGVYIFHGDGNLPLYIGKSVDIRSRVMSHLRNPDEARMLAQTRHITCTETAGEIGALLLESHLIKTQSPLFNQRLRRLKTLCSVQLIQEPEGLRPALVDGRHVQHGITPGLYGLFSSMHAAKQKLTTVAHQHRLCLQCMGLEKATARGCFGWQIKQCAGACIGQESRAVHDDRLREALQELQVHTWPFDGAVNMVERRGDWVQKHRILNWSYQGTNCNRQLSPGLVDASPPRFDLDTYHIVLKPLLLNWVEIEQHA